MLCRATRLSIGELVATQPAKPPPGGPPWWQDGRSFQLLDSGYWGIGVDVPTLVSDGRRETLEIFQRVKGRLFGGSEALMFFRSPRMARLSPALTVTPAVRAALYSFWHCSRASLLPSPLPETGSHQAGGNCRLYSAPRTFSRCDRRPLAGFDETGRRFLAAQFDQLADPVVADRCQMRGCPRRHSAGNRATVENNDLLARLHEFVGGSKPRRCLPPQ